MGNKAKPAERVAMQYTQPKMLKVVPGGEGHAYMVVVEPSQRDKDAAKVVANKDSNANKDN